MLPTNFSLAQYRFTLQALENIPLPPLKSTTLRGGFGLAFKNMACLYRQPCREACQTHAHCPYGYLFESKAQAHDIPRPFIIRSPQDQRTQLPAGETFSFTMSLIGEGQTLLPHIIATFHNLGQRGLGQKRGQYRLWQVDGLVPYTQRTELVYQASDGLIHSPELSLTTAMVLEHVGYTPPEAQTETEPLAQTLTLNFLTPTQLKAQGQVVKAGPSFYTLLKTLLTRIQLLSQHHCHQTWTADFKTLNEQAKTVEIIASQTHQQSWQRTSSRQKQKIYMDGLVGQITYHGHLSPFIPILALGEYTHVGRKTVFGSGQYQILTL